MDIEEHATMACDEVERVLNALREKMNLRGMKRGEREKAVRGLFEGAVNAAVHWSEEELKLLPKRRVRKTKKKSG